MLDSLTCNLDKNLLYNKTFSKENSMLENIIKVKPISFKLMDSKNFSEIKNVDNRSEVIVEVYMYINLERQCI